MEQYAYIRVSTKEQKVDRQLAALETFHLKKNHVYIEYQSGKDFERPVYRKMVKRLRKGDLLIIKSVDRLGRNYDQILVEWQRITKEIQATRSEEQIRQNKKCSVIDFEIFHTAFLIAIQD